MKDVGRARRSLAVAAAVVLMGTLAGAAAGGARPTVTKVVSPDTLIVRLGSGRLATVRLVGVVAPGRGSCHFGEAVAAVRRLALRRQVTLTTDPGLPARDGAGRLLRYVALPDGWDLGQRLVRGGHVLVQPESRPFARREIYVPYAQTAVLASEGMWRRCRFLPAPRPTDLADVELRIGLSVPDAVHGSQLDAIATNHGPRSAADVVLHLRLPAGGTIRSIPDGCSPAEWCTFGLLRPGEAKAIRLTYDAGPAGGEPVSASITSATIDPNPVNDAAYATPTGPLPPFGGPPPPPPRPWPYPAPTDLALTASASPERVAVGERISYSFRLENRGPLPTFQPRLLAPLRAGTAVVSIAQSRGTCYRYRSSVICLFGPLGPGSAATARVVVRVTGAARGLVHVQTAPRAETLDRPDSAGANNAAELVTSIVASG